MSTAPRVVVVGAGVAGLTTAAVLLERGVAVRIVARERSPRTTSDVPAALWYPFKAEPLHRVLGWARVSHARFRAIALGEEGARAGVRLREGLEVFPWKIEEPWWREAVPSFRRAWPGEVPPGFADGWVFEAPVVETPCSPEPARKGLKNSSVGTSRTFLPSQWATLHGTALPACMVCSPRVPRIT